MISAMHGDLLEAAEWLVDQTLRHEAANEGPDELALRLYDWYLNTSPLPKPTGPLLPYELNLPAAVRGAHHETPRFEGGWKAQTASSWGRVVANKGDETRVLERSEYTVPGRRGLRAQHGDALLVSRCWDWVDEETGFWHYRRGTWPPPGADRLVRIYWNCVPAEAPRVIAQVSLVLGAAADVPFMVKTPARSDHNGRADAVVSYLGPDGYSRFECELRATAESLAVCLRPQTPRMTHRLAPGVALTEGKLGGDSFGDVRCRLLADTFCEASAEARRSVPQLVERIGADFRATGLDPARPYLEPGPVRDYDG